MGHSPLEKLEIRLVIIDGRIKTLHLNDRNEDEEQNNLHCIPVELFGVTCDMGLDMDDVTYRLREKYPNCWKNLSRELGS